MDEKVKKFVHSFLNLDGSTIAEKKRNLFRLFHGSSSLTINEQTLIIEELQDKSTTYLQQRFLLEFLIYFRRSKDLFSEFMKADSDYAVSKIARLPWILVEMPLEAVKTTIGQLSYKMRIKFIKKTASCKPVEQCDELFDFLLETYGVFFATTILHHCSLQKIQDAVKQHPIRLSPNQLIILYRKHPKFFATLIEETGSRECLTNARKIFEFIAQNEPDLCCQLLEKLDIKGKLGRRTTRKLILAKRDRIVAQPEAYARNLRSDRFVITLGRDFPEVFHKLFPKRIEELSSCKTISLLQYFGKNGRFNLMLRTYERNFAPKLIDNLNLVDANFVELITDVEERVKWAKLACEKTGDDDYFKYYKVEDCFNIIIKQKWNFDSSSWAKDKLMEIMIGACIANKDIEALLTLCELAAHRLKNDRSYGTPENLLKDLDVIGDKLEQEHWTLINKLFHMPEFQQSVTCLICGIYSHYIDFLIRTNKEEALNEALIHYFSGNDRDIYSIVKCYYGKKTKVQREFLVKFVEIIPELPQTNQWECEWVAAVGNYNRHHPKKRIDLVPFLHLVEGVIIKAMKSNYDSNQERIISQSVNILIRLTQNEEFIGVFWENFGKFGTTKTIMWLLRHKPLTVLENAEMFITTIAPDKYLFNNRQFCHLLKSYTHLGLDKKIIDICQGKIKENLAENVHNFVTPLAFLLQTEEFIKMVLAYKPTTTFKYDVQDREASRLFEIRKQLLQGLKVCKSPVTALPLVLQFCHEDYVTVSLAALYSNFYGIPAPLAVGFLEQLRQDKAVSVKKHAYYLTSVISDQISVIQALKQCSLSQSLVIVLKYFIKNPSRETFELFKLKLAKLNENDDGSAKFLTNWTKVTKVPKGYAAYYFQEVWEALHRVNSKQKQNLMHNVSKDVIKELEPDFVKKIVAADLFRISSANGIVSTYLIHSQSPEKFAIIAEALYDFKNSPLPNPEKVRFREAEGKKELTNFINGLFQDYMETDECQHELIARFSADFQNIFHSQPFLECFTLMLMKFKGQSVETLAVSIVDLTNNFVEKYHAPCLSEVSYNIKKLLPKFFKNLWEIYHLYYEMCCLNQSNAALLVLKTMSHIRPEDKLSVDYFERTLKKLEEFKLDAIQLHLNIYRKKCKDEVLEYRGIFKYRIQHGRFHY